MFKNQITVEWWKLKFGILQHCGCKRIKQQRLSRNLTSNQAETAKSGLIPVTFDIYTAANMQFQTEQIHVQKPVNSTTNVSSAAYCGRTSILCLPLECAWCLLYNGFNDTKWYNIWQLAHSVYLNFPSQHALARFFSFHTSPVQNADSSIPDSSEIGIERFSYNYRVTMVPETYFRQHGFMIPFQMIWQITQR